MFQQIVLASNNAGKVREFSALFSQLGIQITPQAAFDIPECPEPHHTFVENALAKARHAAQHSKQPALADDSGICVAALNGALGGCPPDLLAITPNLMRQTIKKCPIYLPIKPINRVTTFACWCSCATPMTHSRLSPKAFGTDNGKHKPLANMVLAMTHIFICPI